MDILLNENDECRLVLPWADKQMLLAVEFLSTLKANPADQYSNTFPKTNWLGVCLC